MNVANRVVFFKGGNAMLRKFGLAGLIAVLALAMAVPALAGGGPPPGVGDGPRGRVFVYVTSQGKVFESIVGPDLPMEGPFQKLEMTGPTGLQTEFGPGDPGYVGGRWWVDVNGNDIQDEGDHFFSCPLLGTGTELE